MATLAEKLAAKKLAEQETVTKEVKDGMTIVSTRISPTVVLQKVEQPLLDKQEEVKATVVPINKIAELIHKTPEAVINTPTEAVYGAAELKAKIKELADLGEEDLSGAMKDLKNSLMKNPAAVAVMLPEEVGMMVEALRRLTGQSIAEATTKKPKGAKKTNKALSSEEMQDAFDEL